MNIMKEYKILFRTDGHKDIGIGHIVRCLALGDMLRDDFQIAFACQKRDDDVLDTVRKEGFNLIRLPVEDDYDADAETLLKYSDENTILILDGYRFRETYQRTVRPHCHKLVCIDDIHSYHFYADVIINHSEHSKYVEYSCEPHTRLCLGAEYALLRKPFLENADFKRDIEKPIENVMICMGGADPENQTLRILRALELTKFSLTVNVIVGVANPNYQKILRWINENGNSEFSIHLLSNLSASEMCEQFMENDFLFTPGSTTSWEACCIGIPMIVGMIADNQMGMAEILGKKFAALNVGWYKDVPTEKIKTKFLKLVNDRKILKQLVDTQKNIIDGYSKERYTKLFGDFQKCDDD